MKRGISLLLFFIIFFIFSYKSYASEHIVEVDKYKLFKVNDINVNYDNTLTDIDIINNYVEVYCDYNDIKIESDYFLCSNIIGSYKFIVYVDLKDYGIICKRANINVLDNKCPIIYNISNIKIDKYIESDKLFSDVKGYDEIDGDITDKIIITDLDNYFNNEYNNGIYNFSLELTDSSDNYTKKIISVILNDSNNVKEEIIEDFEYVLVGELNIYNTDKYNRNDIKNLLIKNGYYDNNTELLLSSEYFLYDDIEGTYDLYVNDNNEIKLFKINVNERIINKKKKKINVGIIIFIIMMILTSIGIIIMFLIKKKHRLK